MNYICLCFCFF